MSERAGLFVIIALGESILVTGATFTDLEWTRNMTTAFLAAFFGSLTLWWIYFETCAIRANARLAGLTDPGRLALSAYTYIHPIIVAGIIMVAVGDELVLAHSEGHVERQELGALLGGPALFLPGTGLFKWVALPGSYPHFHLVGLVLLAALVPLAELMSPLALSIAGTIIMALTGLRETLAQRRERPRSPGPAPGSRRPARSVKGANDSGASRRAPAGMGRQCYPDGGFGTAQRPIYSRGNELRTRFRIRRDDRVPIARDARVYRLKFRSDNLRDRSGQDSSRVTSMELFFDLVFVFAITQLSHTLLEHLTVRGALEVGLLLMATWWTWMYTTWATNWVDPQRGPIRLMLVLLMFGGLVFSTSIPDAFGDTGLTLAITYSAIQIGRTLFMIGAFYGLREHLSMVRIALWFILSVPVWLAGALAEGDTRLVLWAIALAIDYVAPSVAYWVPRLGPAATTDWDISPSHMAERCGLFIIIALGESVLVAGATFTDLERTLPVVAAFVAAFAGSVTLWWIYFGTIADQASRHFEEVENPGQLAIVAYTYLHLPIVAGIIVVAVGDELVLANPEGHADMQTVVTLVGGPMIFLLGTLLFKVVSAIGRFPVSHVVGLALLAVLIPLADNLSPLTVSWLTTAILFVVGGVEAVANRRVGRLAAEPVIQS